MSVGANFFKASLAQSLGSGGSETTIYLDRITTLTDETVTTSSFSTFGKGTITIDPLNSNNLESCSFTAIDGTNIALTGAVRGLSALDYTASTSRAKYHPVGTTVILAFGVHNLQDIIDYITAQVAAITVGTAVVATATAGETISAAGTIVYLNTADGKWWKSDADVSGSVYGVQLGITQGTAAANGSITNGVMTLGLDSHQSGLVAGTTYYVSNTAGGVSSSSGTNNKVIGVAKTSTALYFDPNFKTIPNQDEKWFLGSTTGMVVPYAGFSVPPTGFLLCNGAAVSRTTYANLFAILSTNFGSGDGSTTFNVPDLRGRSIIGAGAGTKVATFTSRSSNVITVTGLTNAANNEFQTGQAITYHTSSGVMTGLTNDTVYYLIRTGNLTFSLASSLANAIAGTAISLSSDGSGTQTFTLALTTRTLADTGGEENHASIVAEMPAHTHTVSTNGGSGGSTILTPGSNSSPVNTATSSTGGSTAHNTMNPFGTLTWIIKT